MLNPYVVHLKVIYYKSTVLQNGLLPTDAGDALAKEDPLEKDTASHFSILAWKIPWTEEPGRLQTMGL